MNNNTTEKTMKIPVTWRDGHWKLFGGGERPPIENGTTAELSFSASQLSELKDRQWWTSEMKVPFLPAKTEIFVRVNQDNVPGELIGKIVKPHRAAYRTCYVKTVLNNDLQLIVTPGKKGKLSECECLIPATEETAKSVNEAYKKIATRFEPKRRSNTGNIFLLAHVDQGSRFLNLDELRGELVLPVTAAQAGESK